MNDAAARKSTADVRARLIGAWRAVSWFEKDAKGELSYPMGKEANGQLIYTAEGRMSAQLMSVNAARFAKGDWRVATEEERARAWMDYFGYWGSFSIDEAKQAVIHHVEGSAFPNIVGTEQVRCFRFEGERLILNADTAWGKVQVEWEKIK
jgi:Lipocalin-like domain